MPSTPNQTDLKKLLKFITVPFVVGVGLGLLFMAIVNYYFARR